MTLRKGFVLASLVSILFLVPGGLPAAGEMRGAVDATVRAGGVAVRALAETRLGAELVREWTPRAIEAAGALAPIAASPFTLPISGAVFVASIVALLVKRQSPRERVLRLARRGRPVAWIARTTGMAQDEVRARLQPRHRPAATVRKALPGGRLGRLFRGPLTGGVTA